MISALVIPYIRKELSSTVIQADFVSKYINDFGIRDDGCTTMNVPNATQLYTLKCLILCKFCLNKKKALKNCKVWIIR